MSEGKNNMYSYLPIRIFVPIAIAILGSACSGTGQTAEYEEEAAVSTEALTSGLSYKFADNATGFVLDSNSSGKVYTLPANGGKYQRWVATQNGIGGSYELRNLATGRCLDSNTKGSVYTLACNNGNFQRWIYGGTGNGPKLINVATSKCLDSNWDGDAYTLSCNNGEFQKWWAGTQ